MSRIFTIKMRYFIILFVLVLQSVISYSQKWDWAIQSDNCGAAHPYFMNINEENDITIAGRYGGQEMINDTVLEWWGQTDVFAAKFSSNKDLLWIRNWGSKALDLYSSACEDIENNVLVLAFSSDTTFMGDTIFYTEDTSLYLAKFNKNGELIRYNKILNGIEYITTSHIITTDEDCNIYIAGWIYDTISCFDSIITPDYYDSYILKLTKNGEFLWLKTLKGEGMQFLSSISVYRNEFIVIRGSTQGTMSYNDSLVYDGSNRYTYMMKLDTAGNFKWIINTQIDGSNLVLDTSGNIYLTGSVLSPQEFAGQIIGDYDLVFDPVVYKFDKNGEQITPYYVKTTNMAIFYNLIIKEPYLYIVGEYEDTIIIDSNKYLMNPYNPIVLFKYNISGEFLSASQGFGGSYFGDNVYAVGIDTNNMVYMSGSFNDSLRFDSILLMNDGRLSMRSNMYIVRHNYYENELDITMDNNGDTKCGLDSTLFPLHLSGHSPWQINYTLNEHDSSLNYDESEMFLDFSSGYEYNISFIADKFYAETRSDIFYIDLKEYPDVDFTYNINGLEVSFDNNTSNADSYLWDFGDGETSQKRNPKHSYSETGEYIVKLEAFNSVCTDFTIDTIQVQQTNIVFDISSNSDLKIFPNPSTDIIYITSEHEDFYNIRIFNLQGSIVYEEHVWLDGEITIDLSFLQKGSYIVEFCSDTKVFRRKILRYKK